MSCAVLRCAGWSGVDHFNIKDHNSLHGCERCIARGVSVNGRTTFCNSQCYDAERRCHDKFVNQNYAGSHQLGTTLLCQIAKNCINTCALDYMHLVCLGAVRRMLMYWKKGDRMVKLSSLQLLHVSEKLIALTDYLRKKIVDSQSRTVVDYSLELSLKTFC